MPARIEVDIKLNWGRVQMKKTPSQMKNPLSLLNGFVMQTGKFCTRCIGSADLRDICFSVFDHIIFKGATFRRWHFINEGAIIFPKAMGGKLAI